MAPNDTHADAQSNPSSKFPLCVDLDGTLIKTDTMIEGFFKLCRTHLFKALMAPFWLLRGRAYFKDKIFTHVKLDFDTLPYNEELLKFLHEEKQGGRELWLVTGASERVAKQVAERVGLFSRVLSSDRTTNLTGRKKARLLTELLGRKKFAYVGDSYVDLRVWKRAAEAYVVAPHFGLEARVARLCSITKVFPTKGNFLHLLVRSLRVHQWSKNILIMAPVILAHRLDDLPVMLNAFHAMIAFSLVSSSVYLLNDMLDLEADRRHPDNKRRPFASGDLALLWGFLLTPVFLGLGLTAAWALSIKFLKVVLWYYITTLAYSINLKQVVLADIIILACLYAWRLIAGSTATEVVLSNWFLVFAGFFFLSLALIKRCSELILIEKLEQRKSPRRGYAVGDLHQLESFGSASGYISVLVLALYINNSEQVTMLYKHPNYLLWMCPLLLYWISRMWLKAHRGKMYTDPLVFALKDRVSYVMIGAMGFVWLLATGLFPLK